MWCKQFHCLLGMTIITYCIGPSIAHYKTLEELELHYEDDKNAMIAVVHKENTKMYEDFYEEMDFRLDIEQSMNMIFFGPPNSFIRIDTETILHILQYTHKFRIPIARALLAWDLVTDGKTSAFLQGREYLAFQSLLNVIPEEDLYNVNFGDPSVLHYFANNNVDIYSRKIGVLVGAYRRYFGNTWYQNATYINEMGYLICGFPSSDLAMITPQVFVNIKEDAFSKLKRCSFNQTRTLYNIAVHHEAYGRPYKWTSYEIERLGMLLTCIPNEDISSLQLEAVRKIAPEVLKEFEQRKLVYFSTTQIMRMNAASRRIYIIRMQLRIGFDMAQLANRSHLDVKVVSIHIFIMLVAVIVSKV